MIVLSILIWLIPYLVYSEPSTNFRLNEEVAQTFVETLGLKTKPKPIDKPPNLAALDYLKNVYYFKNKNRNLKKRSVHSPISDKQVLNDSDWISTLNTFSYLEANQTNKENGQIWINSCQIPHHKKLQRAELRIFQSETKLKTVQTFLVSVYELEAKKSKKFCSSVETKSDYSGWLEFDLTSCVSSWSRCNSSKPAFRGFHLSIRNSSDEIALKETGLTISSPNKETQPYFVVFLKIDKKPNLKTIFNPPKIRATMRKHCPNNFSRCSLIKDSFTLDFADLGLDFVIAPKGVLLSNCCGSCGNSEILDTKLNVSVKSSVSDKMNYSCGPTETEAMSLLYFDEEMNIVLGTGSLIVNNCGCSVV